MKRESSTSRLVLFYSFVIIFTCSCKSDVSDPISLSPDFPDYQIDYSGDISDIQSQFDNDMWKTFVALCWPSDNLYPNAKGNITDEQDARSVFENYSFNYDLFLLNVNDTTSFQPIGWAEPDALNQQRQARWNRWNQHSNLCPNLVEEAKDKGITNMAEIIPLDEFIQASNESKPHVPLVDPNNTFVWSSVSFNEVTFDFVINKELYSENGIKRAKEDVVLEEVHHVNSSTDSLGQTTYSDTTFNQWVNHMKDETGAMHLKTSWKVLGEGDDPTKFHTAWAALLFNNLNFAESDVWEPQCSLVKVGLVGMHIAIKTEDQPSSIWATFEHVENCPEVELIQNKHYNFYDYDSSIPVNLIPLANETIDNESVKDPHWFNPSAPVEQSPGQIVREVPISDATKALNASYQQALANTVWANYQLISTQWIQPSTQKVYPSLLSNTTLETFDQLGSSCFGCHHQVTANTLKGGPNNEQFTMAPYNIGNVLNVRTNILDSKVQPGVIDTAIYSDYMWSLLKWTKYGHLTWKQTK